MPDTTGIINQGQDFIQNGVNVGSVQYDTATGRRLGTGETTDSNPFLARLRAAGLNPNTINMVLGNYRNFGVNTNVNSTVTSPITPNDLNATTNPLALPNPSSSTAAPSVSSTTDAILQTGLENKKTAAETALGTSKDTLEATINKIINVQTSQATEEANAGIPGKLQKVTDLTNQLEAEQRNLTKRKEAIYKTPGVTTEQANDQYAQIERESLSKQADLGILQSAANRDYATAEDLITKKISLQLEPLKTLLDYQKTVYATNKDSFDKADDRAFNNLIRDNERAYNIHKKELDDIHSVALEAAKNGADQATLQKILGSKNANEALTFAGNKLQSPNTQIIKLDSGDTLLVDQRTGKTIKDFGGGTGGGSAAAVKDGATLNASKGSDGYTNSDLYASTRAKSKMTASDFDNRFGYLLNPNARQRLGVSTGSTGSTYTSEQIRQQIYQQQNSPAWNNASDAQKRSYILSLGANPADFGL